MANRFEVSIDVAAPPEQVWALAGDPARIAEWFPPVLAVEMDGDVRRATMGNGAVLVERITRRDDRAWTYAYSVEEGIPGLVAHEAVLSVEGRPADPGCAGARTPPPRWRATTPRRACGRSCSRASRACATPSRASATSRG